MDLEKELSGALHEVRFVHDYVQFVFDSAVLSLYGRIEVARADSLLGPGQPGFCDALCRLVGHCVVEASTLPSDQIELVFADQTRIAVTWKEGLPETWMLSREGQSDAVG